jgi:hypothetical protein
MPASEEAGKRFKNLNGSARQGQLVAQSGIVVVPTGVMYGNAMMVISIVSSAGQ